MSRFRTFAWRLRRLVGAHGRDADLQREIAAHIDEATEEYVRRGLTPADARRAALLDFGGVVRIEEAYRERLTFRFADVIRRDVRHALRILTKHRTFATIAIATIALAVAANAVA